MYMYSNCFVQMLQKCVSLVLWESLRRRIAHEHLPPFLQFRSLEEPGVDHHLTELLVSGSSPEGGISPNCLHAKGLLCCTAAVQPFGCRNLPRPEIALLPETVGVGEGQRERGFGEITSV